MAHPPSRAWTELQRRGQRVGQCMLNARAPVAQLDRASDFESEGRRFDSCRAYHQIKVFQSATPWSRRNCAGIVRVLAGFGSVGWPDTRKKGDEMMDAFRTSGDSPPRQPVSRLSTRTSWPMIERCMRAQ